MNLINYKVLATMLIFLISLLTIIYPLKKLKSKHPVDHAESFELGEALASGIFLGAAFFHMLPDAISIFQKIYPTISYPLPEMICMIGFLLLLFLERLSLSAHTPHQTNSIPYVLALILIIHSITH